MPFMIAKKNIREQRSARAARLKAKQDNNQQQMQPLQHHYFEMPLPLRT